MSSSSGEAAAGPSNSRAANVPEGPTTAGPSSAGSGPAAASGGNGAAGAKAPPRPVPPFLKPLQFMGVPRGILTWKPRLPSRNWSIFIGVTSTLTSLYIYDRRECRRILEEHKEHVRHLAEEPMQPREWPRKVHVFASKSPGDDDTDKSLIFFKKYVKPILVAAAVDWEVTNGVRHGGLARVLAERHYSRRRQLLGLEPWGTPSSNSQSKEPDLMTQNLLPFSLSPQEQLEREINGGIIIVGRPAYKEWAWGLRKGWTTRLPPARQDLEDELAQELSEDGAFDEVLDEQDKEGDAFAENTPAAWASGDDSGEEPDGAGAPLPSRLGQAGTSRHAGFNPAFQPRSAGGLQPQAAQSKTAAATAAANTPQVDAALLEPPEQIPAQPPLCFVDYVNLTGFRNVPRKLVGFFRHRDRVQLGAQVGVDLVLGSKTDARTFAAPVDEASGALLHPEPPQGGDLDWGLASERFYPPRFGKTLATIEKERTSFYKELPRRLRDTRSYVRGERELTATEKGSPPKSEGDLRQERFNRERDWRNDAMGYEILRPDAGVPWHRAFRGSLRVFGECPPPEASPFPSSAPDSSSSTTSSPTTATQ